MPVHLASTRKLFSVGAWEIDRFVAPSISLAHSIIFAGRSVKYIDSVHGTRWTISSRIQFEDITRMGKRGSIVVSSDYQDERSNQVVSVGHFATAAGLKYATRRSGGRCTSSRSSAFNARVCSDVEGLYSQRTTLYSSSILCQNNKNNATCETSWIDNPYARVFVSRNNARQLGHQSKYKEKL